MEPTTRNHPAQTRRRDERLDSVRRHRGSEAGFSLIEIIVVLVIIAILISVIAPRFMGARQRSTDALVRTAAQSYADAVDSFALDHAGRVPVLKSVDWPADRIDHGPLQPNTTSGVGRTYLGRYVPESVSTSQVGVEGQPPSPGSAPKDTEKYGRVVYLVEPGNQTSYRIEVWSAETNHRFGARMSCYLGSWEPEQPAPPAKQIEECA